MGGHGLALDPTWGHVVDTPPIVVGLLAEARVGPEPTEARDSSRFGWKPPRRPGAITCALALLRARRTDARAPEGRALRSEARRRCARIASR